MSSIILFAAPAVAALGALVLLGLFVEVAERRENEFRRACGFRPGAPRSR